MTLLRLRCRLSVVLLCLFAGHQGLFTQSLTTDEAKAAFVFNFAKFIEWPVGPATAGPLHIGVLGNDGVTDALSDIARVKKAGVRPLAIRRVTAGDDLPKLHVLFLGASGKPQLTEILKRLNGSHVLTVSDVELFCQSGGVIGLMLDGNHLRFEVNLAAAERAQLRVSSKLLTLAKTVLPAKAAGDK
jgi:hypothetical protein